MWKFLSIPASCHAERSEASRRILGMWKFLSIPASCHAERSEASRHPCRPPGRFASLRVTALLMLYCLF